MDSARFITLKFIFIVCKSTARTTSVNAGRELQEADFLCDLSLRYLLYTNWITSSPRSSQSSLKVLSSSTLDAASSSSSTRHSRCACLRAVTRLRPVCPPMPGRIASGLSYQLFQPVLEQWLALTCLPWILSVMMVAGWVTGTCPSLFPQAIRTYIARVVELCRLTDYDGSEPITRMLLDVTSFAIFHLSCFHIYTLILKRLPITGITIPMSVPNPLLYSRYESRNFASSSFCLFLIQR